MLKWYQTLTALTGDYITNRESVYKIIFPEMKY